MFDWLKKLFGEGHIYCDIECADGTIGRAKAPYVGDPDTLDREEYIKQLKSEIWFKKGKVVTKVTNIRVE